MVVKLFSGTRERREELRTIHWYIRRYYPQVFSNIKAISIALHDPAAIHRYFSTPDHNKI